MMSRDEDAAFFEMIHGLKADAEREAAQQRTRPRQKFDKLQIVAPFDGVHLPGAGDFRGVVCRDISTQGFSFVTDQEVAAPMVVVGLGTEERRKYMAARVIHREQKRNGARVEWRVGCEFVARLG